MTVNIHISYICILKAIIYIYICVCVYIYMYIFTVITYVYKDYSINKVNFAKGVDNRKHC